MSRSLIFIMRNIASSMIISAAIRMARHLSGIAMRTGTDGIIMISMKPMKNGVIVRKETGIGVAIAAIGINIVIK